MISASIYNCPRIQSTCLHGVCLFSWDGSHPHPCARVRGLRTLPPFLSVIVLFPFKVRQSKLISVDSSVWFFSEEEARSLFTHYSGQWQKSPNWAHKVAAQRLDREASLKHSGGNLMAFRVLQRPSFTKFPTKEEFGSGGLFSKSDAATLQLSSQSA